jgi:FkbM family methyltransferase
MCTDPEARAAGPGGDLLGQLLLRLPSLAPRHARGTEFYDFMKQLARYEVESLFGDGAPAPHAFGPFGDLVFPFHRMGAVTSLDLFDLDELILFAFYWTNRARYRRVLDVGANLGLHAILLDRAGCEVRAYEPDPAHFDLLERNLRLNDCTRVRPTNAAVSDRDGERPFVRVLGNTTGSHLAGAKPSPYGDLETFPVAVAAVAPLAAWADLMKIDAEGHEAEILRAVPPGTWRDTDALVEVGSEASALTLFEHFHALGVRLFAQKAGWRQVRVVRDVPTSYREGTLFVTARERMPWAEDDA